MEHSLVSRRTAVAMLGATAAGAAIGALQASPAAAASGDAQMLVVSNRGQLLHKIRFSNGAWTPPTWGDVNGATGFGITEKSDVGGAVIGGDLHVVLADNRRGWSDPTGHVWHAIRRGGDGSWTAFTDTAPFAGLVPGVDKRVAAANLGGVLHVVVVSEYGMWHAVRHSNGAWSPFLRPAPVWALGLTDVAVAGSGNGELHVAGIGVGGTLYHRVRRVDEHWTVMAEVGAQPVTRLRHVAMAEAGTLMHVAVASGTNIYHRVRYRDGGWLPAFNLLSGAPGGSSFSLSAAGFNNGDFHLVSAAPRSVYHTVRNSIGAWTGFGLAGELPDIGTPDGVLGLAFAGQL
jgi:hypothetical protein